VFFRQTRVGCILERWSPMLDLSILACTACAVTRGGGAY
jgi:hypothetical protein